MHGYSTKSLKSKPVGVSMKTPSILKEFLKAEAQSLGFVALGVADARPVPEEVREHYRHEVTTYGVGDMTYLLKNEDVRFDPARLLPGVKSIVVLAFNYYPPILQEKKVPQIAYFAYGKDYHRILKDKLYILLEKLKHLCEEPFKARPFVDSAPLTERFWAREAGVGRLGRNGLIIVPHYGSFCFLSEILLTLHLPPDAPLIGSPCEGCSRCIKACPAHAILADGSFEATRCISYQTIERKDTDETDPKTPTHHIFGCDICQQVCPHNQNLSPHKEENFLLNERLRTMNKEDWENLTPEEFDQLFEASPLQRSGYKGILRNLKALEKKKQ